MIIPGDCVLPLPRWGPVSGKEVWVYFRSTMSNYDGLRGVRLRLDDRSPGRIEVEGTSCCHLSYITPVGSHYIDVVFAIRPTLINDPLPIRREIRINKWTNALKRRDAGFPDTNIL